MVKAEAFRKCDWKLVLPHLPSHCYSEIFPSHCGQTRLRIDERMRTFNSPCGASMVIMFELSPRGRNGEE
jgi:hypothetical protein